MYTIEKIKENIDFDRSLISDDLSFYYNEIYQNSHKKNKIVKYWGTVENFIDILYWMRFIKKYNPSEMIQLTGLTTELPKAYTNLGWNHYNKTLKECEDLTHLEKERLLKILDEFCYDDPIFDSDDYLQLTKKSHGALSKKELCYIEKYAYSEEELIRKFYYFIYVKDLTCQNIADMFNVSVRSIQNIENKLGLKLPTDIVQQKAALKRNYDAMLETKKATRINSTLKDGLTGSGLENLYRTVLEKELSSHYGNQAYEIIVGINTNSIIPPREIDIPIILINKSTGMLFKFALEFNGQYWHKDKMVKKDEEKEKDLNKKDWNYLQIEFGDHESFPRKENNLIIDQVHKTIELMNLVLVNNQSSLL